MRRMVHTSGNPTRATTASIAQLTGRRAAPIVYFPRGYRPKQVLHEVVPWRLIHVRLFCLARETVAPAPRDQDGSKSLSARDQRVDHRSTCVG